MVALPLAPSSLRVRVTGKQNTQNIAHIFHMTYQNGTPSNADCLAVSLAFRNAFNTRFASQLPTSVSYSLFEVVDLASLTGAYGVTTTAVTGTATPYPGQTNATCVVVSWKIPLRYRGGHPRTYFPYGSASSPTGGNTIPAAYVTSMSTAASSFINDINGITSGTLTFSFAVVSYYHQKQLRPTGIPYQIVGSNVHSRVDTQRRRLGKEF